jgi:hypothetical protein
VPNGIGTDQNGIGTGQPDPLVLLKHSVRGRIPRYHWLLGCSEGEMGDIPGESLRSPATVRTVRADQRQLSLRSRLILPTPTASSSNLYGWR